MRTDTHFLRKNTRKMHTDTHFLRKNTMKMHTNTHFLRKNTRKMRTGTHFLRKNTRKMRFCQCSGMFRNLCKKLKLDWAVSSELFATNTGVNRLIFGPGAYNWFLCPSLRVV